MSGADASATSGQLVEYLNVAGMRDTSQKLGLRRAYARHLREFGCPDAVLSYNALGANGTLGLELQRSGIPWVPFVADLPARASEWAEHERLISLAAGRVFLSFGSWTSWQSAPKLHLDGGVDGVRAEEAVADPRERMLLYTGALNRYAGIQLLIEAFSRVRDVGVSLSICGKGESAPVMAAAARDPRIRFLGAVPESHLELLSKRAFAFVNPRPPDLAANGHNFPSKVLEYLSYGKPVISSWTAGLDPAYRDVLEVFEGSEPAALTTKISEILGWPEERRASTRKRICSFLNEKRLWSVQAERLMAWLEAEVFLSAERGIE